MATLLEMLNQQQPAQPAATPALGASEQASNLLRTKLTGEALPSTGSIPKRSQIGEQAIAQQAKAQSTQIQQQADIAQAQQRQQDLDQAQAQQIQSQQLAQDLQQKKELFADEANKIWTNFYQEGKKLKTEEDVQNFEQLAATTRLANTAYLDNLAREAKRSGIDNEEQFKEDYYYQTFKDDAELFGSDVDFKKLMDMDERDFIRETSSMDIDFALKMANKASEQANAQQFYGAIGGLISGGTKAYSAYDKRKPNNEELDN